MLNCVACAGNTFCGFICNCIHWRNTDITSAYKKNFGEAKSAAVCIVPKNNTLAYTDYPLTMLYEKDIHTSRTPASITKASG